MYTLYSVNKDSFIHKLRISIFVEFLNWALENPYIIEYIYTQISIIIYIYIYIYMGYVEVSCGKTSEELPKSKPDRLTSHGGTGS